jgi:hypothetical protein
LNWFVRCAAIFRDGFFVFLIIRFCSFSESLFIHYFIQSTCLVVFFIECNSWLSLLLHGLRAFSYQIFSNDLIRRKKETTNFSSLRLVNLSSGWFNNQTRTKSLRGKHLFNHNSEFEKVRDFYWCLKFYIKPLIRPGLTMIYSILEVLFFHPSLTLTDTKGINEDSKWHGFDFKWLLRKLFWVRKIYFNSFPARAVCCCFPLAT